MDKKFIDISHGFIDTLSDGVFSIAITLLGLNVVELVPELTKSENINTAIMENWPTFFAYLLGFVVLFSTWYQYHSGSQYVEGTNSWIIWQHGLTMAWVALMPFGVALLAHNLDTPNRKWAVFYFGVCLFGNYWTTILLATLVGFDWPINYNDKLPVTPDEMRKATPIFMTVTALIGVLLVSLSLYNAWAAIIGYVIYISTNIAPVQSLNRSKPYLLKMVNKSLDAHK